MNIESISAIVGRNPAAVEQILGPPINTEMVKVSQFAKSLRASYQDGEFEVVFIDNIADWIMIVNRKNRTIEDFINFFGLGELKPFFNFRGTTKHKNVSGLKEVALYDDVQGNIWMVYIKAFTD